MLDNNQDAAPFAHAGGTGAIIRLSLVNLLLNIVTLSLWRFWGKTRVRQALWGGTLAWGDPAEYTGTGKELFLGFLMVLFLVFLPLMLALGALQAAMQAGQAWAAPGMLLIQGAIAVLAGAGLFRARRYQLSRTLWRGIRAAQGGSAWHYGFLTLGVAAATAFSMGWAWPWGEMELARYRMQNTRFGTVSFSCEAKASRIYNRFAVFWFSIPVFFIGLAVIGAGLKPVQNDHPGAVALAVLAMTLWAVLCIGPAYALYRAAFWRELAGRTRFGDVAFRLEASTFSLMRLALGNALIGFLSLGALRPWAAQRVFRYACTHLRVTGAPDWQLVGQNAEAVPGIGEGLAAVFDGAGEF